MRLRLALEAGNFTVPGLTAGVNICCLTDGAGLSSVLLTYLVKSDRNASAIGNDTVRLQGLPSKL